MTKKADLPSKTEAAHWLHAVKKYGWYLWSVGLCGLGTGAILIASPENYHLDLFGFFVGWAGLLFWPIGVVVQAVQGWKRFRADKTGHVYAPRFDIIFVAVSSAYALYCCLFLTTPDASIRYAQGDTSHLRDLLFSVFLFLAVCVCGAYYQTHKKPEPVASEEEYQAYKRLAEAQKPHADEEEK